MPKRTKEFEGLGLDLTARGTPRKAKEEYKRTIRKGEEGYWERNMEAAHKAGHEAMRKFKDAQELQEKIDAYFDLCEKSGRLPGEHGLAGHLGITRNTLYNYWSGNRCKDLQETVVTAYDRIADAYLQMLLNGDKNMTSFVIFAFKQLAFGAYQDRIEHKNDTTFKIEFGKSMDSSDFK